jgi:hypothetical protein
MRWLIAGSRSWDAKRAMFATLDHMVESHGKPDEVIHGGAKGADTFAGEWAKARNIPVTVYLADWSQYGKAAGIIRNNKMLDTSPDVVILFMNGVSRGTKHTLAGAQSRGIEFHVFVNRNIAPLA